MPRQPSPPRWQDPVLDEAALAVARAVRGAIRALEGSSPRWATWFEALLPALEDGDRPALETAAKRARAAYGAKDSVMDVWTAPEARQLRDLIDRLQLVLARRGESGE